MDFGVFSWVMHILEEFWFQPWRWRIWGADVHIFIQKVNYFSLSGSPNSLEYIEWHFVYVWDLRANRKVHVVWLNLFLHKGSSNFGEKLQVKIQNYTIESQFTTKELHLLFTEHNGYILFLLKSSVGFPSYCHIYTKMSLLWHRITLFLNSWLSGYYPGIPNPITRYFSNWSNEIYLF